MALLSIRRIACWPLVHSLIDQQLHPPDESFIHSPAHSFIHAIMHASFKVQESMLP